MCTEDTFYTLLGNSFPNFFYFPNFYIISICREPFSLNVYRNNKYMYMCIFICKCDVKKTKPNLPLS